MEEELITILKAFASRELEHETLIDKSLQLINSICDFINDRTSGKTESEKKEIKRVKDVAKSFIHQLEKFVKKIESKFEKNIYLENIEEVLQKYSPEYSGPAKYSTIFNEGIQNYSKQFITRNKKIKEMEESVAEKGLNDLELKKYKSKLDALVKNRLYSPEALNSIHTKFTELINNFCKKRFKLNSDYRNHLMDDLHVKLSTLHKENSQTNMNNIEKFRKFRIEKWKTAVLEYEQKINHVFLNTPDKDLSQRSEKARKGSLLSLSFSSDENIPIPETNKRLEDETTKLLRKGLQSRATNVSFEIDIKRLKQCLENVFKKTESNDKTRRQKEEEKKQQFYNKIRNTEQDDIKTLGVWFGSKFVRAGLYDSRTDTFLPVKFDNGQEEVERTKLKRKQSIPNVPQEDDDIYDKMLQVKTAAEKTFNMVVQNAVISVPVKGSIFLRNKIVNASVSVGFKEVHVVPDVIVAALAWNYQARLEESNTNTKRVLVTLCRKNKFDIGLVEINEPFNVKLVYSESIDRRNIDYMTSNKIKKITAKSKLDDFILINMSYEKNSITTKDFEKLSGMTQKIRVARCTDNIFKGTMLLAENPLSINELLRNGLILKETTSGKVYQVCDEQKLVCPDFCAVDLNASNESRKFDLIELYKDSKITLGSFDIPPLTEANKTFSIYIGADCRPLYGDINGQNIKLQNVEGNGSNKFQARTSISIKTESEADNVVKKAYDDFVSTKEKIISQIESNQLLIKTMRDLFSSKVNQVQVELDKHPDITLQSIESACKELMSLEQKFPK